MSAYSAFEELNDMNLGRRATTCFWGYHASPATTPTLAHLEGTADASAVGLGDVLAETDSTGTKHVIAYARQHLSDADVLHHS